MTEQEYRAKMYKGNKYVCEFCGAIIEDKPTLTLCVCKGMAGTDIGDICEECLVNICEKVICNGTP